MKIIKRLAGGLLAAVLTVSGVVATAPAAAAAPEPIIRHIGKEYAPKGKKGEIVLPWMYCSGSGTNQATIRKIGSSKVITRSWRFGMAFVRVAAGRYRVSVKATCNGRSSSRTQTVRVRKEKDSNTITRSEYHRIKKGMTLSRVKEIVGTKGIDTGGQRYFDRAGSFRWAEVWFGKGRVAGKSWDAPLGDSSVR